MADEQATEKVTFTLDGREVTAEKGEMIIAAAEAAGTYIPRFCYHPRMEPVGVCRMCLVEVEGPRGSTLMPACYVAVGDGMEVVTDSEKVKKAQDGVLEFLLANHPLDCPVCDKGGECPLQDQTLVHGPGESRFVEEKRHFAKPLPISELVLLDRERCIQCSRCTRFAEEVAGEALIDFAGRGDQVEVATFPGRPFSSYYSGNTVQICPVGALTATPYRFAARPWDLEQVESTCTGCAVGCRVAVQSSAGRLTRLLGVDSDPVNHSWLCDKGRFSFEGVNGVDEGNEELALRDPRRRLTAPMVRRDGVLVEVGWSEAIKAAAHLLQTSSSTSNEELGAIGGAQLTNEGAYAWASLLKGVLGTDSVDAQLGDGLDPELMATLPRATIDEAAAACTVIVLSGDLREELPVLFLRLRESARTGRSSIIDLSPAASSTSELATVALGARPGDALLIARALEGDASARSQLATHPEGRTFTDEDLDRAVSLIGDDGTGVVIILGRPSLAEDASIIESAALQLHHRYPKATFLPALRRANVMGAIDMGLVPGMVPGRVRLRNASAGLRETWKLIPASAGRSSIEQVEAFVAGTQRGLVVLGAQLSDLPDAALAARVTSAPGNLLVIAGHGGELVDAAAVVLPAAVAHERPGTTTNIEGRVSTLGQKVVAPGLAWPDWMIAGEIAFELGHDFGWSTIDDVTEEIARVAPSHEGLTTSVLAAPAAADGLVVPLKGTSSPRALLDPVATPGLASPERVGLGSFTGTLATDVEVSGDLVRLSSPDVPTSVAPDADGDGPTVPAPDSYSLRLVATRTLYDDGAQVLAAPALALLRKPAVARVNPYDLDRLGVTTGDRVRLRTPSATLVIEVEAAEGTLRGTVALDFNVAAADSDVHANAVASLIEPGSLVTDVRMESL